MSDSSTSSPVPVDPVAPGSSEPITVIQSEEQFREATSAYIVGQKTFRQEERFSELAKFVHEALREQDSDKALTLLTK